MGRERGRVRRTRRRYRSAPASLLAFCARHLARYKVPTEVVLLDELPRNATGKVLKAPLRERAAGPA